MIYLKKYWPFHRLLVLSLGVLPVATNLHAQAEKPDSAHSAVVSILCRHVGLPVLIDDIHVGTTPLQHHLIAPGEHEFSVKREDSQSWFDADWVTQATVSAGDTLELVAEFLRGYFINSTPYGAQVWRNGRVEGTTPLVLRLPEGVSAPVEITMEGYRPRFIEVGGSPATLIPEAVPRRYEIVLEKDLAYATTQEQENIRRGSRRSRYRRLSYIAAGASLAASVAAIYFKHEADQAYRQYQNYGDPLVREHFYDRAKRYDGYSGAAFAAFQISFACSFYGFLQSLRK
ncbi:PEGA domain-containing protein [candidate division KSB1 bacterium]|nr:MAG: PEGA domain-containing protein [candidate division KSB1 bacterium]MBC6947921.1 PEGA domain-containing protein [candidate division KSB1 bacterium]MCE7943156.1 PEGA domain-containing protein [Chlorobi bacterium CHB1]MDL1876703.1 PEGA domain-containing protein [Cytophagia bacterium CHB2]